MPNVSGFAVTVTMAAALRQGSVSVAFPASFLPQFVPVVLDVGLLFQTPVICLSRFHSHVNNIHDHQPPPIDSDLKTLGRSYLVLISPHH